MKNSLFLALTFNIKTVQRGLLLLLAGMMSTMAQAGDVSVMSTVAFKPALTRLAEQYQQDTGNTLHMTYGTIAGLKKQIDGGATADVIVLSRPVLDALQEQGKVARGSIVNTGSSYVAIGVRAGASQPDISTVEKLKSALLSAKSIAYADPAKGGASGVYFAGVLRQLGIAEQLKNRTVLVPGAEAGEMVVQGRAEIAVAQASEIAAVPGTQVVGPLPGEFSRTMIFAAGIGATSTAPAAARALITLLNSPTGIAVLKSGGMGAAPDKP
ncbi:TPA: molybdate ABC transporter substrate-binding protein [Serratia marcescens]|uniref:molybdate ABC transporter substrate-binding protein n=1 Tax=Serratia ureilytica TaxID=300181 RepID=UPI0018D9B72A|nr:substrate-binding domain-containing protein [Serratia ureilytica]MBH2928738.1 substrate-binding domain-containing protein [Serratia ureilytica]